jgi:hypothetical protein
MTTLAVSDYYATVAVINGDVSATSFNALADRVTATEAAITALAARVSVAEASFNDGTY